MPHPLDEHALPGIGPLRRARLTEAGIHTLETLVDTSPEVLSGLTGFNAGVVRRALAAAQQVLASPPPPPLPEVPDLPGSGVPPSLRETSPTDPPEEVVAEPVRTDGPRERSAADKALRRGLETARRIETTLDAVRRCRAHVKDVDGLPPLRKELKRLRRVLESVQRESITHGLSSRAAEDLEGLLSKLDARLDRFAGRAPSVKRTFKMLERVQAAERKLAARIG